MHDGPGSSWTLRVTVLWLRGAVVPGSRSQRRGWAVGLARRASYLVAAEATVAGAIMNNFFLPRASNETVESFIQVNNQRWPQFNIVGTKQHFHRMMQAIGVWNSASHSVCISAAGYGDGTAAATQFLAMYDLEAVPHCSPSPSPGAPSAPGSGS